MRKQINKRIITAIVLMAFCWSFVSCAETKEQTPENTGAAVSSKEAQATTANSGDPQNELTASAEKPTEGAESVMTSAEKPTESAESQTAPANTSHTDPSKTQTKETETSETVPAEDMQIEVMFEWYDYPETERPVFPEIPENISLFGREFHLKSSESCEGLLGQQLWPRISFGLYDNEDRHQGHIEYSPDGDVIWLSTKFPVIELNPQGEDHILFAKKVETALEGIVDFTDKKDVTTTRVWDSYYTVSWKNKKYQIDYPGAIDVIVYMDGSIWFQKTPEYDLPDLDLRLHNSFSDYLPDNGMSNAVKKAILEFYAERQIVSFFLTIEKGYYTLYAGKPAVRLNLITHAIREYPDGYGYDEWLDQIWVIFNIDQTESQ